MTRPNKDEPSQSFTRFCIFILGFGGFLFGFNVGVVPGILAGVIAAFHLHQTHSLSLFGHSYVIGSPIGLTVATSICGTLMGAPAAGVLVRPFGSRLLLRISGALFLLAAQLGCFASGWVSFLAARLLTGIAIGTTVVLCPLYIAELARPHQRGKFVGGFQLNVVLGNLVAFTSNYLIALSPVPESSAWRLQVAVAAVPALFYFFLLFKFPSSPRWLMMQGRRREAEKVLRRFGVADIEGWMATQRQIAVDHEAERGSLLERSAGRFRYRRPIMLAVLLAGLNQLCGINIVLYYLHVLLSMAGANRITSHRDAVLIACAKLVGTIAGLAMIDRLGRSRLLLLGAVGMTCGLAGSAIVFEIKAGPYWLFWMFLAAVGFYAASLGTVIWVYLGEFFPSTVRARGQALGSSTHWIAGAFLTYMFPLVVPTHVTRAFVGFALATTILGLLAWRTFPETNGMPLDKLVA